MTRQFKVNEHGLRVGEDHPNAKLTDHEVDLMRRLHDDGVGYKRLARMFEVSQETAARICRYEVRNQSVCGSKKSPG